MDLSCVNRMRESTADGASQNLFTVNEEPQVLRTDCSGESFGLDEFGTAFATAGGFVSKDIGILWPPIPGGLADYHVPIAPQYLPRPPLPPAEAPLRLLLALASVVGLPRQIEREEENMVTRCP